MGGRKVCEVEISVVILSSKVSSQNRKRDFLIYIYERVTLSFCHYILSEKQKEKGERRERVFLYVLRTAIRK